MKMEYWRPVNALTNEQDDRIKGEGVRNDAEGLELFYFPKERIGFWEDEMGVLSAVRYPESECMKEVLSDYVEFNFMKIGADLDEEEAEAMIEKLRLTDSWEMPAEDEYDVEAVNAKLDGYIESLKLRLEKRRGFVDGPSDRRVSTKEMIKLIEEREN